MYISWNHVPCSFEQWTLNTMQLCSMLDLLNIYNIHADSQKYCIQFYDKINIDRWRRRDINCLLGCFPSVLFIIVIKTNVGMQFTTYKRLHWSLNRTYAEDFAHRLKSKRLNFKCILRLLLVFILLWKNLLMISSKPAGSKG